VVDDRGVAIVVDVDFHAFYASLEILEVSLDFGVTGQLVATEVGVMRRITEVVSEGQIFIDFYCLGSVVDLIILDEDAEFIEIDVFPHVLGEHLSIFQGFLLLY
jgi:hypothetical protein